MKPKQLSPIERAIDAAVKCTKCGAGYGQCDCWTQCKCGWMYAKGGKCANPIHPHYTDDEILIIARDFTRGLLGKNSPKGMAYIVCAALEGYLSFLGVENVMIEVEILVNEITHWHKILLLQDGRIIDPTASQFKNPDGGAMPEVYLGALPEWYTVRTAIEPGDTPAANGAA